MMTEPMTLAFVALPWHLKFKFIVTKKEDAKNFEETEKDP